ncbi:hypothetical protein BDF20DRAFT_822392 [Mycotypha africana]|uniref:uncharacterized protein n=1 Tax=Mycotypha africana TaxID=64632 RepID=UPI002300422F|nr:uncharacterized protein BDF20DRAFT_822392 [Mycotypha africana]KAI8975127.1 hypothetical protein BDF20DRAFT_822392 [Mycotypha africana]
MATPDTTTTTLKNNKGVRISPLLQKQDKDDYNHPSSNTNEEEKYLAYLPHSGLSNQRIELANALLLSYMTNRTLIVPPAFLGSVFGWMQRDQLLDRLDWLTTPKAFTKICQSPTPGELATYVQRSRCSEYRQFAIMDWTEIHDFSPLTELGINIKFQQIFSMTQIKNDLQITNDERDIYLHQDTQLYDWRLYQNMTEAAVLHYRMDTRIGDAVKRIVDYMGGKGTFMSVHFRTGDNPFRKEIGNNLRIFRENMTQLLVQEEHYHDLQQLNERQQVKVYIATDHKDPRNPNRSQLLPWFRDFPCTTVLKDLPNYLFDPLDTMHDIVVPTKELRPFLIPIVDAMVAAHGRYVLTTPRSTFSGYIKELHDVWV